MKTKTKVMIKDIAKTGSKLNVYRHRWAIMYFMLYLVVGYKFIRYAVENLNFLESGFTFLKSISFDLSAFRLSDFKLHKLVITKIIVILVCNLYFDKYATPSTQMGVYRRRNLFDYMEYHPFPSKRYFGFILLKSIPIMWIFAVVNGVISFIKKDINYLSVSVLALIIPFIIGGIRMFIYELDLSLGRKHGWFSDTKKTVVSMMNVLFALCIFLPLQYLGINGSYYATWIIMQPKEADFPSISFFDGSVNVVAIFVVILFLSLVIVVWDVRKLMFTLTAGMACFAMVIWLLCVYEGVSDYVNISQNEITVVRNHSKTVYTLDDISLCQISKVDESEAFKDEDPEYQCSVLFKDGKSVILSEDDNWETNSTWEGQFKTMKDYFEWLNRYH
ncbi:MAG: hypothetical protein K6G88_05255 [Lachnospiraceae bacterium]|nr:hypothetical protein [Lachnospiraceae bacterium]